MKKIDLHGETFETAQREVESFINRNWGCGEEMEIITGHSPRMKSLVMVVLGEYNLDWQVGDSLGFNMGIIRSKFE